MGERLDGVLERSKDLGLLGPGPVAEQVTHALGFARAWSEHRAAPPPALCDLGAGGGVPGLVLAAHWPSSRAVLLEATAVRCEFLREALAAIGLQHGEVAHGRVERLAREPAMDGAFDLVTARSFGPPAVTAECAARLLRVGGLLLVADPPGGVPDRWPPQGLARLGQRLLATGGTPAIAVVEQVEPCDPRFPRREGVPAKRPLF